MDVDNGGWTLFFRYIHAPGSNFELKPNTMPENMSSNSHVNIKDAGFTVDHVREIRFMCIEEVPKKKSKIWHFKTTNTEILNLALTGDQKGSNVKYK
jgi:hypothetical protein